MMENRIDVLTRLLYLKSALHILNLFYRKHGKDRFDKLQLGVSEGASYWMC